MLLVPAGEAWRELVSSGRFARLDVDGLHPSALGAYLVAATVYSTIYDKPASAPELDLRRLASVGETSDADLLERQLSAEDARALQQAAWAAARRHGAAAR